MRLRIYFTEYDEDKYSDIREKLAEMLGGRLVEHRSKIAEEFRYLEVEDASSNDAEKTEEFFRSRGIRVKIDRIEA